MEKAAGDRRGARTIAGSSDPGRANEPPGSRWHPLARGRCEERERVAGGHARSLLSGKHSDANGGDQPGVSAGRASGERELQRISRKARGVSGSANEAARRAGDEGAARDRMVEARSEGSNGEVARPNFDGGATHR